MRIDDGHQIPPVINERIGRGSLEATRRRVPNRNRFLNSPPHIIIRKVQPQPVRRRDVCHGRHVHRNQPVLAVPLIIPHAIKGQVPIRIIGERGRVGGEDGAALVGESARNVRDVLPHGLVRVGHADFPVEILAAPIRQPAVHRHRIRRQRRAADVLQPRRHDAGVLVQAVGSVADDLEIAAISIPAKLRGDAVANVVVGEATGAIAGQIAIQVIRQVLGDRQRGTELVGERGAGGIHGDHRKGVAAINQRQGGRRGKRLVPVKGGGLAIHGHAGQIGAAIAGEREAGIAGHIGQRIGRSETVGGCLDDLQRLTGCRRQNINAVGMFCDHGYRLPFFRVRGKSHFCSQMHRCGCAEATLLRAADGGEGQILRYY